MSYLTEDPENANEVWLEAAYQNFEEALEGQDWDTCNAIMLDVKDKGFQKEYESMRFRYSHERFEDR